MANEHKWLRRRRLGIGVVVTLTLIGATCSSDEPEDTSATTTTTTAASMLPSSTTATASSTSPSSTTTTTTAAASVDIYFSSGDGSNCAEVAAFPRPLPDDADAIEFAFGELVKGPTAGETDAGAGSFFSQQTADAIRAITLRNGLLVVDFIDLRTLMPNASASCGSEALLAQLDSTAFQFDDVNRTRYLIEGSCDDFANWLQRECFDTDRSGDQLDVPTNERASGSGCTPPPGDGLADGRWYGFVDQTGGDELSFDLACWFTGTAAAAAAAEDGEESPPPNDYYIRNESDRLRALPVDTGAIVDWLPNPGDPASVERVPFSVWQAEQPGRADTPGVWLDIAGGLVARIEEQYVP